METLYHVSTWAHLASVQVGHSFTLRPGPQGAEGLGVYFAQAEIRVAAADAVTRGNAVSAVVAIKATLDDPGWFRTKAAFSRKFGRPRTWHTKGKTLVCRVVGREGELLHCAWEFGPAQ